MTEAIVGAVITAFFSGMGWVLYVYICKPANQMRGAISATSRILIEHKSTFRAANLLSAQERKLAVDALRSAGARLIEHDNKIPEPRFLRKILMIPDRNSIHQAEKYLGGAASWIESQDANCAFHIMRPLQQASDLLGIPIPERDRVSDDLLEMTPIAGPRNSCKSDDLNEPMV